jgi:hypothetical protein
VSRLFVFILFQGNLLPADQIMAKHRWLRSGRWELICVCGALSVVCHLMFWSGIVPTGNRRIPRE